MTSAAAPVPPPPPAQSNPLQFPCKSCGAKLDFDPKQTRLKCGYCGYAEDIPQSEADVKEHDFENFDPKKLGKGLGKEFKPVKCEQCGANTEVDPKLTSLLCAFCGSNQVIPREQTQATLKPESLLPFKIAKDQVIDMFRTWIQGLWFRPNALKQQARPDGVQGVYIPYWTYDAMTYSFWRAEAGYHYYVTESYRDQQGQNRTRQVQKTRWEPVSGRHSNYYDDVLVPASKSVEYSLAKGLEPFDTKALVPYKPDYLAGIIAEDYQSDVKECWPKAKSEIDDRIRAEIVRMIPGDTHRNLSVKSSYNNRTYKLCLLPIWIATYRYQDKPYRYLVNGQTGKVHGEAPYSWIKITLFVLALIAVIVGIVLLTQGGKQ